METFERVLETATNKESRGKRVAHGIIVAAIDKSGNLNDVQNCARKYLLTDNVQVNNYIYKRTSGSISLQPDAPPISFYNALVMVSYRKLTTTIAALQCVERDLVALDEPIETHLPELTNPQVITYDEKSEKESFILTPIKSKITLRQLVNHSSGPAYDLGEPALEAWRKSRCETPLSLWAPAVPAFSTPLLFETGTQWVYGSGIDWVGLLICRLSQRMPLENCLIDNYKPGICQRFLQPAYWVPDETLIPGILAYPHPPADEYGGNGLLSSVPDYMSILGDIIKDQSILLKPEAAELMFTPQFPKEAPPCNISRTAKHYSRTQREVTPGIWLSTSVLGVAVHKTGPAYRSTAWNAGLGQLAEHDVMGE